MNTKQPALHALNTLMAETWAITDTAYDRLVEIASRENVITPEVLALIDRRKEAVAAKKAMKMDGADRVVTRDGVAIIEVAGPIFRYANLFTDISGATSIQTLATDFNAAIDDPNVKAVVLAFDSPGGQVSGTNEMANMIAARRGEKPILAYVGAMAASGAYWLASATDEIVVEATAEVGSIGAIVLARVPSAAANVVEKVSSQSPRKRMSPASEAGGAELQAVADQIAQVFIDFVAAHRPAGVDMMGGGMAMGQKAVDAKLADRVGSLEMTIADARKRADTMRDTMRRMGHTLAAAEAARKKAAALLS